MGREYESLMGCPESREQVAEMKLILDEMKLRWAQIKEPTLVQRVHRNMINRRSDKKTTAQIAKESLNRLHMVKREVIEVVLPVQVEIECGGCRLCGKPTLNCYCSAECKDLDRI